MNLLFLLKIKIVSVHIVILTLLKTDVGYKQQETEYLNNVLRVQKETKKIFKKRCCTHHIDVT